MAWQLVTHRRTSRQRPRGSLLQPAGEGRDRNPAALPCTAAVNSRNCIGQINLGSPRIIRKEQNVPSLVLNVMKRKSEVITIGQKCESTVFGILPERRAMAPNRVNDFLEAPRPSRNHRSGVAWELRPVSLALNGRASSFGHGRPTNHLDWHETKRREPAFDSVLTRRKRPEGSGRTGKWVSSKPIAPSVSHARGHSVTSSPLRIARSWPGRNRIRGTSLRLR
jgi:hypothetical protein